MKNGRRIISMLILLLIAGSLFGCAASQPPKEDAPEQSTTVPHLGPSALVTKPDDFDVAGFPLPQIRLHNMPQGWMEQYIGEDGCFVLVHSRQELMDLIDQFPGTAIDSTGYDDAFFAENRLVVIPRTSNSGSVRYTAKITQENGVVNITLAGRLDGEGTMDMADWLVFVDLPIQKYGADTPVSVPAAGGSNPVEK